MIKISRNWSDESTVGPGKNLVWGNLVKSNRPAYITILWVCYIRYFTQFIFVRPIAQIFNMQVGLLKKSNNNVEIIKLVKHYCIGLVTIVLYISYYDYHHITLSYSRPKSSSSFPSVGLWPLSLIHCHHLLHHCRPFQALLVSLFTPFLTFTPYSKPSQTSGDIHLPAVFPSLSSSFKPSSSSSLD